MKSNLYIAVCVQHAVHNQLQLGESLLRSGTLSVWIEPPKVVKQLIPPLCVIEAERTQAALMVAKEHDIFVVPRVIELEAASGQLVLEYLPELTHPLDRSIVHSGRRTAIYKQIGQAVACLHANLDVSYAVAHGTRAGGGARQITDVVLHGDCHPGHTLWSEALNKVAVIDWSGMYISGQTPSVRTYGPRRRDTMYWIVELVSQALRTKNIAGFARCPQLVDQFIRGYEESAEKTISREQLRVQYKESVKTRFRNKATRHKQSRTTSAKEAIKSLMMLTIGPSLFR